MSDVAALLAAKESEAVERKESWNDDCLKALAALGNTRGGTLLDAKTVADFATLAKTRLPELSPADSIERVMGNLELLTPEGRLLRAARINVALRAVHLREMTTKWASISTAGRLTLNTELLSLPRDLGEFVIVHELVHLLCPDSGHGRVFKAFMLAYLPNWEARQYRLDHWHDNIPKERSCEQRA